MCIKSMKIKFQTPPLLLSFDIIWLAGKLYLHMITNLWFLKHFRSSYSRFCPTVSIYKNYRFLSNLIFFCLDLHFMHVCINNSESKKHLDKKNQKFLVKLLHFVYYLWSQNLLVLTNYNINQFVYDALSQKDADRICFDQFLPILLVCYTFYVLVNHLFDEWAPKKENYMSKSTWLSFLHFILSHPPII